MKTLKPLSIIACTFFLSACAQTPVAETAAAAPPAKTVPIPAEFKASTVAALVLETGLAGMLEGAKEADTAFMPPFFRYSLQVRTTGKIRPISSPHQEMANHYAITHNAGHFTQLFTHEVEVSEGGKTFWILWQKSLITPFEKEMNNGGAMNLHLLLLGARGKEVLFFAIGYKQTGP